MDTDVQKARQAWRTALEAVDELVDRFVARLPVDADEWASREEDEYRARRAYYSLLRERYGLLPPSGMNAKRVGP